MKLTINYKSSFDLSIDKYFRLLASMKEAKNEYDKSACIVAAFTDSELSEIEKLSINDFKELWANVPDPKKSHTPMKLTNWAGKAKHTITINGKELSFSPNLTKFTIAQYIDFQLSLSKVENNPESLLSTILVPSEAKGYNDGYDSSEHIQWIRENLTIGQSNQIIDFFLKRYLRSISRTAFYSEARMRAMKMRYKGDTKIKLMAEKGIIASREIRNLTKSMLSIV